MTSLPTECRQILCVFPRYSPSFGTFEYAFPLLDGVSAFMPPQGLLVVAAALPTTWEVRFRDENIGPATAEDFAWADAVFVSGMHIQRPQINDICRRAHAYDKTTVLGGPSVSACPEQYPEFDYLHVGELGDATDDVIARLACDPSRPIRQVVLTTRERRELVDFPIPAYELVPLERYFIGSIQFSSGCPYQCEFCDIPGLYGRTPRLKTPEQIIAELDTLLARGTNGAVYFVDDNFIAHRRAVRELLPHLVEWQKRNGYPFYFACEATLNIAKRPEILELMREASFGTVFCGIETPDPDALRAMSKEHNLMVPIVEAIRTLNSYGLEVVSGIILGLDTDKVSSGEALVDFIERSNIPMLTINLLQALPRTPLWDRLAREGRLIHDDARESKCGFQAPLRGRGRHLARLYGPRLSARSGVRALCLPDPRNLPAPHQVAKQPAAPIISQYSPGRLHAVSDYLGGRRPQQLSQGILEVRATAAATRGHRESHRGSARGASSHHVCARRSCRTAQRFALLRKAT